MNLARLLAGATQLVEAEGGQDAGQATSVHSSSPLEPVCTEPYCGGFWWAQLAPKVPHIDGELGSKAAEESQEATKVDFPEVSFYPAFDPPISSAVKLLPANRGAFDRWNIPNAVTVKVGTLAEMKFLTHEVLNNFMRVQEDAGLGEPEYVVRQGLQLISWKPRGGRLHVTPFLGSKKEMMNAILPATFTFGGKPTSAPSQDATQRMEPEIPDAPNYGQYLRQEDKPRPPMVLPVKRLDFVLHRHRPLAAAWEQIF
ncbi:unnamed protein product [Cladocopium goreaui]|uniref:Uncharacterized protein n=1 Tax=Cladocopium goreaui TaxID=2562237 RepID=A0A9P1DRQ8_9DINO|nr:unnamed protein product [Cladocopium goreaui]